MQGDDVMDAELEIQRERGMEMRRTAMWRLTISMAVIVVYLNMGGIIFWLLEGMQDENYTAEGKKNWTYLNSVYFCAVTQTTIGYGDMFPTYWASRLFNVFFIFTGLALVGFAIGTLGSLVSSWSELVATDYIKKGLVDKGLSKAIKAMQKGAKWADRRLSEAHVKAHNSEYFGETIPIMLSTPRDYDSTGTTVTGAASSEEASAAATALASSDLENGHPHSQHLLHESSSDIDEHDIAESDGTNIEHSGNGAAMQSSTTLQLLEWLNPIVLYEMTAKYFLKFYDFFWRNIGFTLSIILYLFFEFAGAAVFMLLEGWSYGDALYFCIVTLTTIGYGDIVVETVWGKVVLIVYCFVGLGILANMIQNVGSAVMSNLSRMKSTKESLALAEMDEMIERMRDHSIPKLRSSRKALHVQNQLLETLKLVAERVIHLQEKESKMA